MVAIGGVIYGHWLLVSVSYAHGQLSGVDALDYIGGGRWVTWLFQVMPVFFLVGGYVNAQSWMAHHARGETWTQWVRDRVLRLLWPAAVFLVVGELAVLVARAAGAPAGEVAEAGWLAAIQLWFLPAYMALIALTPLLVAAHRRWGLAVPAVMAAAAGLVDMVVRVGPHLPAGIGYLNYVSVGLRPPVGLRLAGPDANVAPVASLRAGRGRRVRRSWPGCSRRGRSGSTWWIREYQPAWIALLAFAAVQSALVLAAESLVSGLRRASAPGAGSSG